MALIRSLLVRLGMESASFDTGTKKAKSGLYGLTQQIANTQRMMGQFGRVAIAARIGTAAVEGFTAWHKAAMEGASSTEIFKSGLLGLAEGIPIVGRLTKSIIELKDQLSGAALRKGFDEAMTGFRQAEKEIRRLMTDYPGKESKADKEYREQVKRIIESAKLPDNLSKIPGLTSAFNVATSGKVGEQLRMADLVRDAKNANESLKDLSNSMEMFYMDTSTTTDSLNSLNVAREMENERIKQTIDTLSEIGDGLSLYFGEEEAARIHREVTQVHDLEEFKRGRMTTIKNPAAGEFNTAYRDTNALAKYRGEVLINKQDRVATKLDIAATKLSYAADKMGLGLN